MEKEKTVNELGQILREMYDNALDKEKECMVALFGIKYGELINVRKYKVVEIVRASGIKESLGKEIYKGKRLSKYVSVK